MKQKQKRKARKTTSYNILPYYPYYWGIYDNAPYKDDQSDFEGLDEVVHKFYRKLIEKLNKKKV